MCLIPLHPQSLSVHFNLDCTFGQTGKDYHTSLQYYFKCKCFKVINITFKIIGLTELHQEAPAEQ